MYHIKPDKRALASAELICSALAELMQTKAFKSITVSDVQRVSTVSRSTFYRGFDCLEDVLQLMVDRGFDELAASYDPEKGEMREAVFRYWFRHGAVLEALINNGRVDIMYSGLRRFMSKLPNFQFLTAEPELWDYFVTMIASVMSGVLLTWAEHGRRESESEVMELVRKSFSALIALGIVS